MFGPKSEKKLVNYIDPTGEFSNRELKLSEWYLKHKILMQKIGTGILLAWCIVTMSIGIGYFGYYLIFGYSEDQLMYARQTVEFQNYADLQAFYRPLSLQIKNVQVFESATNKFDFAVQVLNPNERWSAHITYKYRYNGVETPSAEIIILPGEQQPVIYFGAEATSYPNQSEFVLENVSWEKINTHLVKNVSAFIAERKLFVLENFKFTPASRTAGVPSNIVEFDLINTSAYSYWEPKFIVELIDGDTVGYLYLSEEQFRSADKRHVDVRNLMPNLNVSDIRIFPIINVFDKNEFMEPGE